MAANKTTIYIQDDVVYHFEQDNFGHKHIADAVVASILNTNPPYTIGIFGGWGTGKSSLLRMIASALPPSEAVTVTIDAWKYSSSDNLRRSFLVHVAKILSPEYLDDLRRKLYTSEQETSVEEAFKRLEPRQSFLQSFWGMSRKIFAFSMLVFLFLIVYYSIVYFFENQTISGILINLDWQGVLDSFKLLAAFPFLLPILSELVLNIFHRPVTIIHERIDADELFSDYFAKVVNVSVSKVIGKKRLVVFIDNLDRLNDEKMVEALESLKTYLANENCIFVVACDDSVVRSVVNRSNKIPKHKSNGIEQNEENSDSSRYAGEHYLDKFFQQTFRLPEYMAIDLHDFALKNFSVTKAYTELVSKKIDIRYLISIILPSDVGSPRKVKRLLNEFIALYEIVKRKESDDRRRLRAGYLSDNVEFLGKFSTIRAEYPDFYKLLIKDPNLLKGDVLEYYNSELIKSEVGNLTSLISYLKKTESILVDDIDSYIWLSQDSMSLGLAGNIVNQLRIALANGDVEKTRSLLEAESNESDQNLTIKVASRIVEQRLTGIDQTNGARTLAYLLPKVADPIKNEIAHVALPLMVGRFQDFSTREIFNVLRWAKRGGIETQRHKLIDQIFDRLNDLEVRKQTFETVLENTDLLEQNSATSRIDTWLEELLRPEKHATKEADENIKSSIVANREFAEWILSKIKENSENDLVIDSYFSKSMVDYAVFRLLGNKFIEGVELDTPGVGNDTRNLFEILAKKVNANNKNSYYWNGVLKIIEKANIAEDFEFGLNYLSIAINNVPPDLYEKFIVSSFSTLERLSKKEGENKLSDEELNNILNKVTSISINLRKIKGAAFDQNRIEKMKTHLAELFELSSLQDSLLDFVNQNSKEFNVEEVKLVVSGLLLTLEKLNIDIDRYKKVIDKVIDVNDFLDDEFRNKTLVKIDELVSSNVADKVNCAVRLVERIIPLNSYRENLMRTSTSWIGKLSDDEINTFTAKNNFFELLITEGILDINLYVEKIINLLPLGGDVSKLQIAFDKIEKFGKDVSDEKGKLLFNAVLANIEHFGGYSSKALRIISFWLKLVEEDNIKAFELRVISLYKNSPDSYLPLNLVSWIGYTVDQIRDDLIQIHLKEVGEDLRGYQSLATKTALEKIDISERKDIIISIWERLVNDRNASEIFMNSAKDLFTHDEIDMVRRNAVDTVRENADTTKSIINLRLLASTIRNDVYDIDLIVDLFENLLGRGADDVQMALKYITQCLNPFELNKNHKYALAEALSKAITRSDEEIEIIKQKAEELKLKWFKYKNKDKD